MVLVLSATSACSTTSRTLTRSSIEPLLRHVLGEQQTANPCDDTGNDNDEQGDFRGLRLKHTGCLLSVIGHQGGRKRSGLFVGVGSVVVRERPCVPDHLVSRHPIGAVTE